MKNLGRTLIIILIFSGCSKSPKEKFIEYKSYDSYPLWESVHLLKNANQSLVDKLSTCDSTAIRILKLTNDFTSRLNDYKAQFAYQSGGYQKDGSMTSRGNVEIAESIYIKKGLGLQILELLDSYLNELSKYDVRIKIRHRFYEQSWKNTFTFEEYLFQYETPEEIFETLNRMELRVLIEINKHFLNRNI